MWSDSGSWAHGIPMNVVMLLQATLAGSIPLILGALAGCMGERAGVINIAIEGQLLLGAFTAAIVASTVGVLWLGSSAARWRAVSLAWFSPPSRSASSWTRSSSASCSTSSSAASPGTSMTGCMVPNAKTYNKRQTFSTVKIPGLGDIPIIGPIFFDSTIFLYITYAAIIWFRSVCSVPAGDCGCARSGSTRPRPTPSASGYWAIRYRNLILGGMLAGIGGAYLTIGSVGTFSKDMSSGLGYIALAAMIFGRWTPLGATLAALLFGFTTALGNFLGSITVPISPVHPDMAPYVATIIAVAGLVGRVRAPGCGRQTVRARLASPRPRPSVAATGPSRSATAP